MARKKTIPVEKLVATQEKRNYCLERRLAGLTQKEICEETGWDKSAVSRYISTAIADITRENATEFLEVELARLDAMWAAIWEDIVNPGEDDRNGQTWKIDRALAIMDQRAKLTGSYKTAEMKAVADARGNLNTETSSMVGRFFDALEKVYEADGITAATEAPESADDEQ
jgi:transcriptional regulator with XRE-family HTH domain